MALCLNKTKWNMAYLWVCCLCYKEKASFVDNLKNLFTIDPKMANDLSFKLSIVAIQLTTFFNTFDMQNCNHLHQLTCKPTSQLYYIIVIKIQEQNHMEQKLHEFDILIT
jgi:hypothetical protein